MKPLAALALLLLLAGCSAPHGHPTPSTARVSVSPRVFSATGPSQQTLAAPAGAKSAEISVTCGSSANDSLTVAVGAEEQPRGIRCPATLRFRTAVGRTLILNIDLSGGAGRYVGQVRFSAEPFAPDPTTTAQCHALSGAFSDIASAQNGYPNGPLDLSGWQDLMVSVGGKLKAVDDSGEIGTQLPALVDWYGRSDPTPANPSDAAVAASGIVHQLCLDNGTPLVIASQFGG